MVRKYCKYNDNLKKIININTAKKCIRCKHMREKTCYGHKLKGDGVRKVCNKCRKNMSNNIKTNVICHDHSAIKNNIIVII